MATHQRQYIEEMAEASWARRGWGTWLRQGPGGCVVCGDWVLGACCSSCIQRFAVPRRRCPTCALPLPPSARIEVCPACQRQPPPWRSTSCAFDYTFPWDGLVQSFKFANQPELAGLMSDAVVREVRRHGSPEDIEWVLPVPLSDQRLQQRGYDQAWELARAIGRSLGIRSQARVLRRLVDTAPQSSLDRQSRALNLKGAFGVDPSARASIAGKRLALVDDVMTTGASVRAAAHALLDAGARSVDVWCVARTP